MTYRRFMISLASFAVLTSNSAVADAFTFELPSVHSNLELLNSLGIYDDFGGGLQDSPDYLPHLSPKDTFCVEIFCPQETGEATEKVLKYETFHNFGTLFTHPKEESDEAILAERLYRSFRHFSAEDLVDRFDVPSFYRSGPSAGVRRELDIRFRSTLQAASVLEDELVRELLSETSLTLMVPFGLAKSLDGSNIIAQVGPDLSPEEINKQAVPLKIDLAEEYQVGLIYSRLRYITEGAAEEVFAHAIDYTCNSPVTPETISPSFSTSYTVLGSAIEYRFEATFNVAKICAGRFLLTE